MASTTEPQVNQHPSVNQTWASLTHLPNYELVSIFFHKNPLYSHWIFFSTAKWQKITSEKKKLLDVASGMIRTQFSKILLNKKYENKKMFNDPS